MTAAADTRSAAPPQGPFGSYDADDVTWLLTDLSSVPLEVGTQDREEAIQGGRPYYEMLPVEYQPDEAYLDLYAAALAAHADQVAAAVATVADRVLARHDGEPPVLVSLARAGTPAGILLRRWFAAAHGLDAPHHTISIVRGGGIDTVALDWLLARFPARRLRFVDGWTGKGAIVRELTAALADYVETRPLAAGLDSDLAVLADPGGCTPLHGTREDFLIPSACLNSTVSGLVSRTVYRPDLIRPGMFHGAKFYAELASGDVSRAYVAAIADRFGAVTPDRSPAAVPTWAGWSAVQSVADEFGIDDLNLVKPGVGETTRVLLRRVPWLVLLHEGADPAAVAHIEALAAARGVEVRTRGDLPYACIGLIRPAGR